MKELFKKLLYKIKLYLQRFSFKTGVIVLSLCVPFYILSFAQMALNFSYSVKGILWVVFFGLAKTFQYLGLAILGMEGIKRLKNWWCRVRNKNMSQEKTF